MTEQATITDNDIKTVIEVIDTVTTRGAFRGDELLAVGTLRQKFAAFLFGVQQAQAQAGIDPEEDDVIIELETTEG